MTRRPKLYLLWFLLCALLAAFAPAQDQPPMPDEDEVYWPDNFAFSKQSPKGNERDPLATVPVKKEKNQSKPVAAMTNIELARAVLAGHIKTSANQQAELERWAKEVLAARRVNVPKGANTAPKDFRKPK